ncbi:hypothetical protein RMSM_00876 [Rhodopirellula maiorica SM1]|uniref:Response regulatory domain-containing protein n=1 Tax=Rhodopirellula maiorica SM1 TaxID=1265738 RepID=M5RS59_9BACT|nr:hypothetical protein RMSM_00876 [Rhodopirellula maiorica SM1]
MANQIVQKAMRFDVNERYQSAAELNADVRKAITMLERGITGNASDDYHQPMAEHQDDDEIPSNEGEGYVVLLVESKIGLQNAIRDRLKARGYRVLIIQDPNRALARFATDDEQPADCVIFGAADLGVDAVDAYNRFAKDENTCNIPSILLIDRRQTNLIQAALRGPKRKMLGLPLKVRELRQALSQLLVGVDRRPAGTY